MIALKKPNSEAMERKFITYRDSTLIDPVTVVRETTCYYIVLIGKRLREMRIKKDPGHFHDTWAEAKAKVVRTAVQRVAFAKAQLLVAEEDLAEIQSRTEPP